MANDDNKNDMILQSLKADWKNLDEAASDQNLSSYNIQQQIHLFHQKRRKAFMKELILFIFTAIFLLSLFVTTVFKGFHIAVYIQLFSILAGPIVYLLLTKRDEGKALR